MTQWSLEGLRGQKAAIFAIASIRGARNLRVFGSVARGTAQKTSDVDFLVELEPGRSLIDLGGLAADLQELLDCKVDIVSERGLRPRFAQRVQAEARPL
jgi:predicted nucleotidyltransferase